MRLTRSRARDQQLVGIEKRLTRLERRVEDVEDAAAALLMPDRLDELAERLDELSLTAVTADELLHVRMRAAQLAAELASLQSGLTQHAIGRDQLAG